MRIVTVAVIDLTRPVEQKGFKSCLLVDCTVQIDKAVITDIKSLTDKPEALKAASAFFANGGQTLTVIGQNLSESSDGSEIKPMLDEVMESNKFYGITAILPVEKQKILLKALSTYADGNECLVVTELVGTADAVKTASENLNSDRVAIFASNADAKNTGLGAGVCGMGFPQAEGSITWANKVITSVPLSKYSAADEQKLAEANINYLTEEMGFNITQFGRTLSGSNIDITRSKDWLKNRIAEALTSALVNSKKIPYTTKGLATISNALSEVGAQAIEQDMLVSYEIVIPDADEIPVTDKANRILRNVKFIGTLSGAIETIEMELQVKL